MEAEAQNDTTPAPDASTTPEPTPDYAAMYEAERAKNARLKADVDKHRTRAQTVEEEKLQKASLEEQVATFKQRAEEAEQKAQAAEAARLQAARIASLTGKVADPKAALKLLEDDHLTDDGDVKVDALLAAYPFLAPKPSAVDIPGSKSHGEPTDLRPEHFKGKSQAWIAENLHRLKPPPK